MDEFHDSFLPNSSWVDPSSIHGSSLVCTNALATASDTRSVLPEPYVKFEQNQAISTDQMIGGLQFHEFNESATIFTADDLKYGVNPSCFSIDDLIQPEISNNFPLESQHKNQIPEKSYSFQGATGSSQAAGTFCVGHGSGSRNENEPSVFPHSSEDSQSISGVPPLWTTAYPSVVPSLAMNQVNFRNFGGFQGEIVKNDIGVLGGRCSGGDLQKGTFQTMLNEQDLHNPDIPSFTPASQMNSTQNSTCIPSNNQSDMTNTIHPFASNAPITPAKPILANANGTSKQRRARRGQATDPHSIAERLRREKIAERMKSLQELVPNSNKTDKASMLDEIIDYVKFLQLQVKVLSMSRVGAAGAVVPLISDIQLEEAGNLPLSPSADLEGNDLLEPDDSLEFEREVVKLMESNITMAMQYLQTKGLCLMPTALAGAISSRKGSTTAIPPVNKELDASTCETRLNESMKKEINGSLEPSKCCDGTDIRQE